MNETESLDKLSEALAKCQGEIEPAEKNGKVDYNTKKGKLCFKYSTLNDLKNCSKKALSQNGLCIIQPVSRSGKSVSVTTRLMHSSGQWIQEILTLDAVDQSPQSIGSVTTYAKRYSYAAMLSIPDSDDDDGQAAAGINAPNPPPKNPYYNPENNNHKQMMVKKAQAMGIEDMEYCKKMHEEAGKRKDVKLNELDSFIGWFTEQMPIPTDISQI